jgi:hypothetical protein
MCIKRRIVPRKKKSSTRAECADNEKSMRIETHIDVKCQMDGRWRAGKRMMVQYDEHRQDIQLIMSTPIFDTVTQSFRYNRIHSFMITEDKSVRFTFFPIAIF